MKFAILISCKLIFSDFFILNNFLLYLSVFSYIVSVVLTLMQKKLIRFLAYSSISHISLVLTTFILFDLGPYSLIYLIIYFISLYKIIYLLEYTIVNLQNIIYLTDLNLILELDIKLLFVSAILELGSFPPYNIFFCKIIFIYFLVKNNLFTVVLFFLIFSVFSYFYYLRIIKNLYFDLNSPFVILNKNIIDSG